MEYFSWLDLIKKQIVYLTIQYNHNRAECVNMSIRERINSHLHFWHHHQTHTYTLALKREEGGEGGGGSDEWLFVVVAVVVPIYSFCRSQYDIICWQEFNYTYWKNREKWLECVNYIQYSSNNTHKKGRHSVIIFNIAVKN
jgi:hypothetical protein